jgi:DNA sulfur modification protein DndB
MHNSCNSAFVWLPSVRLTCDEPERYNTSNTYILPKQEDLQRMPIGYTYTFPALRGIQAGQGYYVAMCPLRLLPKLFLFDECELPPELRAQRTINLARIPAISRYVLDNRQDYAFSAITASIDGSVVFEPAEEDGDAGRLIIPMSARFIINDGQHRRAAIEAALEVDPTLADETIAVVFYLDTGLQRSQQLFADLNKHAVRPTKSIGILYEKREPLALLARELASKVPCFQGLTEMEKTTISNRSTKLFTLSAIYQATAALLHKHDDEHVCEQDKDVALRFWLSLSNIVPEWRLAADRKVSSSELRTDYIHTQAVILQAIGIAGHQLVKQHPKDWERRLKSFGSVNWSRSNEEAWEGRAMINGKVNKSWQSIQSTSAYLKTVLKVKLSLEEEQIEARHLIGRSPQRFTK